MQNNLPIVITPGEPAGVGPDLVIQWAQREENIPALVIADPDLMAERAELLKLKIDNLTILPVKLKTPVIPQQLNPLNSAYVLETLKIATDYCMQKKARALVTGPVHKGVINQAGIAFTGHTHFLADLTHTKNVVMLFVAKQLRMALVTDHIALKEVSQAITTEHLMTVIKLVHEALIKQFHITEPKINICGLNPHAGENGYLGDEEIKTIIPVLEKLRAEKYLLQGPMPADTAFIPAHLNNVDAIIAMYHDQGLTVLKHIGFDNAVNITLGLPFVRTSVDHGTALDLAGTGKADGGSFNQAITMAMELSRGTPSA